MPASKLAVATLALPVLRRSCLSADRFPGFAFAVLLVEILQELCRLFGAHLAHLHGLFLGFFATLAVARILFGLLRLGLLPAIAVGTFTALAAAGLATAILILVLVIALARRTLGPAGLTVASVLVLVLLVLILVLILIFILILILVLVLVVLLVLVLLLVLGFLDASRSICNFWSFG